MGEEKFRDEKRKFVVFIDSMGDDDMEMLPWAAENCYDGTMDAGNPYVTPKVMGEIYTGKNPAEHGMPSASRYEQDARMRPAAPTLPEIVAEDDTYDGVMSMGLPFIVPAHANPTGQYWHRSEAMGGSQTATQPQEAERFMFINGPAGDLSDPEEDGGVLWNMRRDTVRSQFEAARTIADVQDFDVVFLGIRIPDSYVHYRYTEPEDREMTDRDMLLNYVIDNQLEFLTDVGEVFIFGDHGGTELDDVFRLNRWLWENGWLEVDIDEERIAWAIDEGLMEESDGPGTVRRIGQPGVTLDEEASVAVSADPFSGGITLLDGATESDVKQMIADLEAHEYVEEVEWSREKWDGDLIDECPDLYLRRKTGIFVSANLAEEKGGAEITRDGVHHPTGAWGATTELESSGEVTPTELHDIILEEFLGIEDPAMDEGADYGENREELSDEQRQHLADMGYI